MVFALARRRGALGRAFPGARPRAPGASPGRAGGGRPATRGVPRARSMGAPPPPPARGRTRTPRAVFARESRRGSEVRMVTSIPRANPGRPGGAAGVARGVRNASRASAEDAASVIGGTDDARGDECARRDGAASARGSMCAPPDGWRLRERGRFRRATGGGRNSHRRLIKMNAHVAQLLRANELSGGGSRRLRRFLGETFSVLPRERPPRGQCARRADPRTRPRARGNRPATRRASRGTRRASPRGCPRPGCPRARRRFAPSRRR